jgi:hypothetical protein
MSQIRISSPTAAAAFVLVELLGEQGGTVSPKGDGSWEIAVTLGRSGGPKTLPIVLSIAREWLDTCGLPGTRVSVGAQVHSLTADTPAAADRPAAAAAVI